MPTHGEGLLDGLNPIQREAVTATEGPVLIVAGAGSGKTRVLTYRIAHLIRDHKVDPFSILAITFTNKAADEMRQRVSTLVGSGLGRHMWVCTFHSACVRILRREAPRLGYTGSFTIYDQSDALRLTGYVLRDLNIDPKKFTPRSVHEQISSAKNELVDFETFAERAAGFIERKVADVYRLYQQRLQQANALDFDDLLMLTVNVFQAFDEARQHWQERFEYVMVDEYQDTNRAQFELVRLLGEKHRNVCVVGDADQSIYAFRGADIRNILEFEKVWPEARVVMLEQNYRSTQMILDAANSVIAHNLGRKPKNLWTEKLGGELLTRFVAEDQDDEAAFVALEVGRLVDEGGRFGDVAVFYRVNAQSRTVEEAFARYGVPYRVVGGLKFYDRREVKDILAYLRILVNRADSVSFKRVLNTPRRGIGDTTERRVDAWAEARKVTFADALDAAAREDVPQVSGRAAVAVGGFLDLLAQLRSDLDDLTLPGVVEAVGERSGYRAELEAEGTLESRGRLENIDELISSAKQWETDNPGALGEDALRGFLESLALVTDTDDFDEEAGTVTLMTLHNAKGLEFPVVFLIGMEDGVFPHMRAVTDPTELEEERRLCYVGMTRAQEKLYLTHAWSRTLFGGTHNNPPSRFLKEIPEALLEAAAKDKPRGTTVVAAPAGEPGLDVAPGDVVHHDRFGRGQVIEVAGEGDRADALVKFDEDHLARRLLLAWAPLRRADPGGVGGDGRPRSAAGPPTRNRGG